MRIERKFISLWLIAISFSFAASAKPFTANVLAPALVGQTTDQEVNRDQWAKFESDLEKMKELGIQSISTQVWWEKAEPIDNQFDWSYYKKISEIIIDKGLKWSPIISFNSCEEKECNIKIPAWLWEKYKANEEIENVKDLKFVAMDGSISEEFISFWATEIIAKEYKDFIQSFAQNFKDRKSNILEIVVSLGPSGELRYPISNKENSMPNAYSSLAKKSFRAFVKSKYKTVDNINDAWQVNLESIKSVQPPKDMSFFSTEGHKTDYGKDFYDWYNSSLTEHAIIVLTTVIRELNKEGSSFNGVPIGAIIPGSLWSATKDDNRYLELNAGVIRSSDIFWKKKNASGYDHIISSLKEASDLTKFEKLNVHLTAIEMTTPKSEKLDGEEVPSLAFEISKLANSSNLEVMGQNQSVNVLGSNQAWDNIWNAVQNANYKGLTIKTMNDLSENPLAYDFYKWIIENMNE